MIKDDFDRQIIELLRHQARLSYAEIGRSIGLSPSAVAERIQRLEETGVITAYVARINGAKSGQALSVYVSLALDRHLYKQFVNALDQFPEIVDCSRITGRDCLMIKLALRDATHLEAVIDRMAGFGSPTTYMILTEMVRDGQVLIDQN